ncbi:MAG: TIGR00282 family metallophosphoesterase [Planctomycetota bacterium]|jgi:metallophosphoesterase (TIGR00282 family)
MRVLMIGDVFGRPGRRILKSRLPDLREERSIDFVVANGENAAGGAGITPKTFKEILSAGVDVVTSGNHVYRQRDVLPLLDSDEDRLLRPANYSERSLGRGTTVRIGPDGVRYAVLNVQGRVFMPPNEHPFAVADALVTELRDRADVILVDFHGEATSEKRALGFFLDGRVSAVVGTHTHVPTADAQVLEKGTAYVTDLGMTGPHDSCIGVEKSIVLKKLLTGMPVRFEAAAGDVRLQGLLIDLDAETGLATAVERVDERGVE